MSEQSDMKKSKELLTNIQTKLQVLRLNGGKSCDFIIKVGKKEIPVHKSQMAAVSDYFEALIFNDMLEHKQNFVIIEDIDELIIGAVIDFCYTSEIMLNEENVQQVTQAASRMQVNELTLLCLEYLDDTTDQDNCLSVLQTVHKFTAAELPEKALNFVLNQIENAIKHKDFRNLDEELLIEILSHDKLVINKEEEIITALEEWINGDAEMRASLFDKLLGYVRFPLIEIDVLQELSKAVLPFNSQQYKNLIDEAIEIRSRVLSVNQLELVEEFHPRQTAQFKYGQWLFIVYENRTVLRYDPCLDKSVDVSSLVKLPSGIFKKCIGAVIIGDNLYLVTAFNDNCCTVEHYDILQNRWTNLAAKSSSIYARSVSIASISKPSVFTDGQDIFVVQFTNWQKFSVYHREWSGIASNGLPQANRIITTQSPTSYIIYAFDYSSSEILSSSSCVYWHKSVPINLNEDIYHGCLALGREIYIVNSLSGGTAKDFRCIDLNTGDRRILPDMNLARRYCKLIEIDGLIVVIGGESTNTSEVYNPVTKLWTEIKLNFTSNGVVSISKYVRKT